LSLLVAQGIFRFNEKGHIVAVATGQDFPNCRKKGGMKLLWQKFMETDLWKEMYGHQGDGLQASI